MILDIFRAGSGDCILITSSDGKTRMLADGGLPTAYKSYIAAPLSRLRDEGKDIDVVYVSHIDEDHIGGILGMLDAEVAWRVADHMKARGKKWKDPALPRPPRIKAIWHNAFLETVAATNARNIDASAMTAALSEDASTMATAFALGRDPAALAAAEDFRMLALSVGQAIAVNGRIKPDQLDIPLNPPFDGGLMVWKKAAKPIKVGKMQATVLGPTRTELEKLRGYWNDYLNTTKGKQRIANLRKQQQKDADNMASADIGLGGSEIVTPPNVASLVLLLEENGKRVLLTGDADDKDMLPQFEKAGLTDSDGFVHVDVLKVPHHGAHNSFSRDFARTVRARHYVFCGDGEHGNPERDVVEGYIQACKENPPANGGEVLFWFNCSELAAPEEFRSKWKELAKVMKGPGVPAWLRPVYLPDDVSMRLEL